MGNKVWRIYYLKNDSEPSLLGIHKRTKTKFETADKEFTKEESNQWWTNRKITTRMIESLMRHGLSTIHTEEALPTDTVQMSTDYYDGPDYRYENAALVPSKVLAGRAFHLQVDMVDDLLRPLPASEPRPRMRVDLIMTDLAPKEIPWDKVRQEWVPTDLQALYDAERCSENAGRSLELDQLREKVKQKQESWRYDKLTGKRRRFTHFWDPEDPKNQWDEERRKKCPRMHLYASETIQCSIYHNKEEYIRIGKKSAPQLTLALRVTQYIKDPTRYKTKEKNIPDVIREWILDVLSQHNLLELSRTKSDVVREEYVAHKTFRVGYTIRWDPEAPQTDPSLQLHPVWPVLTFKLYNGTGEPVHMFQFLLVLSLETSNSIYSFQDDSFTLHVNNYDVLK